MLKCMYCNNKSYMPRRYVERAKMKTTLCDSCGAKLDKKYSKKYAMLAEKYSSAYKILEDKHLQNKKRKQYLRTV